MVILGFDPGGQKQFGWCAAEVTNKGRLRLCASNTANHAADAVKAALREAGSVGRIKAAAIDSPLFWIADGDRSADKLVRIALRRFRAGSTVQHVNSLQGACLAQGMMAAYLLRNEVPAIRITESHPKALLWLLGIASAERAVAEVRMSHLVTVIECESSVISDHERDAALGAIAALAMIEKRSRWRDLYREEREPFAPVSPVEYWMPVDLVNPP